MYYFLNIRYGGIYIISIACVTFMNVEKITLLLQMVVLCRKLRTSSLAGSMLRVNCPIFSPFAQPIASFLVPLLNPHWALFSSLPAHTCEHVTTTDGNNKPESSSVWHSYQAYEVINHVRQ
jgi:hypothetical protein